jgi:hypothetical protein
MKYWNTHTKDAISDRFGHRVVTQLDQGTRSVHPDISERLRIAREQALARRRIVELQASSSLQVASLSGGLTLGWGWGTRISSLLPAILLLIGLLAISAFGDDQRAHELADVDTELLSDELPPDAYVDSGFAKFLQLKGRE